MLSVVKVSSAYLYKEQNCEYHIAHGKDHIINNSLNLTLGCVQVFSIAPATSPAANTVTENTDKTAAASKTQKRTFCRFLNHIFTSDYFHNFFVCNIPNADIEVFAKLYFHSAYRL